MHPTLDLLERHEIGRALDVDAGFAQAIDQQPFVLVLRKNQRVGKRTDAGADIAEDCVRDVFAGGPEIDGAHWPSSRNDRVSDADLAVQLERACLHGERARRRPRLLGLVDDPHAHAQQRQPQRQHKTGRPGADNEDLGVGHFRATHRWSTVGNDSLDGA